MISGFGNLGSKSNVAHGGIFLLLGRAVELLKYAVGIGNVSLVDLVEVVVLGRQPENRNTGYAQLFCFPSQPDGAQGLVDREDRSAEESNLLAGYQRTGAHAKLFNVRKCRGRRAPRSILPLKDVSNTSSAIRWVNDAGALVFRPIHETGRSRIELLNFRCEFEIVEEKLRRVGNLAEWKTVRFHRSAPLVGWQRYVMRWKVNQDRADSYVVIASRLRLDL